MFRFLILECDLANRDHKDSLRQYAHVNHLDGVICVAHAIWGLPDGHFYGILAHEVGHLLMNAVSPNHPEEMADAAFLDTFGLLIHYRTTRYGKDLQWLARPDIHQFLKEFKYREEEGWITHPKIPPPGTLKSRRRR